MKTFLNRCIRNITSPSRQNQSISTVPIFRTHRKEEVSRDFGMTTEELSAKFVRMAKFYNTQDKRRGGDV